MNSEGKKATEESSYNNRISTGILILSFVIHFLVVIFFWDLSYLPSLERASAEAVSSFMGVYLSIIVATVPAAIVAGVFYLYPDDTGLPRAYRVFSITFLLLVLMAGFGAII